MYVGCIYIPIKQRQTIIYLSIYLRVDTIIDLVHTFIRSNDLGYKEMERNWATGSAKQHAELTIIGMGAGAGV